MAPDTDTIPADEPTATGRRGLLGAAGVSMVAAACAPPTPPAPTTGPATTAPHATVPTTTAPTTTAPTTTAPPTTLPPPDVLGTARHLASRATFGATAATVQRIVEIGAQAWLEEQLDPAGAADAESLVRSYSTLRQTNYENEAVRRDDEERLFAELDHATLLRAVHSERQLYEVMCDFWTNHFNVWRRAKYLTQLKTRDNETVVRPHALGRFADLLMASAKSPAMLVYLDNYVSDGQPGKQVNENYGRELLELHTLGIVDGTQVYDEEDVLGVSRVLSGWGISWEDGPGRLSFAFAQHRHYREPVSVLGGAWSRPSRSSYQDRVENALGDGESLIDFLAHHPSTARNIAYKLARRFVSDAPPAALVDSLASTYLDSDTRIAPVLRRLFGSPEFAASVGQKVKRPLDWMCSALRATGAQIEGGPTGQAATRLRQGGAALGQPLFERRSPDGWPETASYWVSADGLLTRWQSGARLGRNKVTDDDSDDKVVVDLEALLGGSSPATVRDLVIDLAGGVLQFDLSTDHADSIAVAVGADPAGPADAVSSSTALLGEAVALLLAHPSFHRR